MSSTLPLSFPASPPRMLVSWIGGVVVCAHQAMHTHKLPQTTTDPVQIRSPAPMDPHTQLLSSSPALPPSQAPTRDFIVSVHLLELLLQCASPYPQLALENVKHLCSQVRGRVAFAHYDDVFSLLRRAWPDIAETYACKPGHCFRSGYDKSIFLKLATLKHAREHLIGFQDETFESVRLHREHEDPWHAKRRDIMT
jgi:hypothetical protein